MTETNVASESKRNVSVDGETLVEQVADNVSIHANRVQGTQDIAIGPNGVTVGDTVTIDVTVYNDGTDSGTQEIEFEVDETVVETRTISLDGEESTTESFSYTTDSDDTPDPDDEDTGKLPVKVKTDDTVAEKLILVHETPDPTPDGTNFEASIEQSPEKRWKVAYDEDDGELQLTNDDETTIVTVDEQDNVDVSTTGEVSIDCDSINLGAGTVASVLNENAVIEYEDTGDTKDGSATASTKQATISDPGTTDVDAS